MLNLQDEIKQSKPFSSLEEEVYLNIQRTAYILAADSERIFRSANLTGVQYNVLRILRGAGKNGLACSEISNRLITKDSDITRLLGRLEKMELINRCTNPVDRRGVDASITKKGLSVLTSLDEPIAKLNKDRFGHLTVEMLEQLNALLVLARSGDFNI